MLLKYYERSSNIQLRNFERAFNMNTGGVHMSNEDYKKLIAVMIDAIDDNHTLQRIYKYIHKFFIGRTGK